MLRLFLHFCLLCSCLSAIAQPAANNMPQMMPDSMLKSRLALYSRQHNLAIAALAKYDIIITYEREVYVGKIHNITFTEVRYTSPTTNDLNAIGKSRVSQILYSDGRRDVFIPLEDRTVKQKELVDTARIIVKSQKDWMKVMLTENPQDVTNLVAKGAIKAQYEADMGNMGNEEMMRQAGIILKKKAAILKAPYVLIETKFFHKSYGDLPSVEVTARAFGYSEQ